MARKSVAQSNEDKLREALETAQANLAEAQQLESALQGKRSDVVDEITRLQAITQRPADWENIDDAADALKEQGEANTRLMGARNVLASIDNSIELAQQAVSDADRDVFEAHADIRMAERTAMRDELEEAVKQVHAALKDYAQLNNEAVNLGRQSDNTFNMMMVPTARVVGVLNRKPTAPNAPVAVNPHVEYNRLEKIKKDNEVKLAAVRRKLPVGHLDRDYLITIYSDRIKHADKKLAELGV